MARLTIQLDNTRVINATEMLEAIAKVNPNLVKSFLYLYSDYTIMGDLIAEDDEANDIYNDKFLSNQDDVRAQVVVGDYDFATHTHRFDIVAMEPEAGFVTLEFPE